MWRITDDKEAKLRRSAPRFPGMSARAFTSIINIIIVMSTVGTCRERVLLRAAYAHWRERCCTAYANKYDQTMLFYAKRESRGLSRQREGQYELRAASRNASAQRKRAPPARGSSFSHDARLAGTLGNEAAPTMPSPHAGNDHRLVSYPV